MDKCGLQPHQTISDAERNRREAAVNYAHASIGLEGFRLSEANEPHARRLIAGEISLQEFVQPHLDASVHLKSSS